MPGMRLELDVVGPKPVLFGLLAATAAFAGTLVLAVAGQAVGALAGGCGWIGLSTPVDRQVWALVNQPTLDFASQPGSLGYWAGSSLAALALALGALPLLPRRRTLAAELVVVHAAWAATVVGLAWLPLVDRSDGHLWRWLELWDLPTPLAWLVPAMAIPAAVPPVLRLLALLRISHHHASRVLRLAAVFVHLVLPAIGWLAVAAAVRGAPLAAPSIAVGVVATVALTTAWYGYPPAFAHRLERLTAASWIRIAVSAALLAATVVVAGRPLVGDRRAGVLWGRAGATNNIRPWIGIIDPGPLRPAGEPIPVPEP